MASMKDKLRSFMAFVREDLLQSFFWCPVLHNPGTFQKPPRTTPLNLIALTSNLIHLPLGPVHCRQHSLQNCHPESLLFLSQMIVLTGILGLTLFVSTLFFFILWSSLIPFKYSDPLCPQILDQAWQVLDIHKDLQN